MKKTIKMIDLLNKIANDEEVPRKIKWGEFELEWEELGYHDYRFLGTGNHLLFQGIATSVLNDEIEIIEEDKKIEKIKWNEKTQYKVTTDDTKETLRVLLNRSEQLKKSLNEIIDTINELKGKSE